MRAEPLASGPVSAPTEGEYCADVVAVVVTHNPTQNTLLTALESVARQVSTVVVVDNASKPSPQDWIGKASVNFRADVEVLVQADNLGLGAGYNVGLDKARSLGAAFVLLLDQDSELEFGDGHARLRAAHRDLAQQWPHGGGGRAALSRRQRRFPVAIRPGRRCFRFQRVPCEERTAAPSKPIF
jgi:hypothetical protein